MCVLSPYGRQTAGPEYSDDPCSPWLPRSVSYSLTLSLALSPLSLLTKPKGNQWTLAGTGQPRAQSKQRAKNPINRARNQTRRHTQAAHAAAPVICQVIHMLHIYAQIDKARSGRVLHLLCQRVGKRVLAHTHTRARSHTYTLSRCVYRFVASVLLLNYSLL